MKEKTVESKIVDIIGFFLSLNEGDKKKVFRILKDFMEKE